MAFEVVMPRLGWNMEEGALASWRKNEGDQVAVGEILFEVESDKAIQEVEALESGILHIPAQSPSIGTTVPVGTLLGYLLKPGEKPPAGAAAPAAQQVAPAGAAAPAATPAAPVSAAATSARGAGAAAGSSSGAERPASPRARRVAAELGVDLRRLQGSGSTGRIVERDVRAAAGAGGARADRGAGGSPMSATRRKTAERMAASAHTAAAVTLTTQADATEMVSFRERRKAEGAQVTYNDILVALVSRALFEHPELNARLEGASIVRSAAVHVGIAVDTERGLLVPVLRDAQAKDLAAIARESSSLVARAREGRLGPAELEGGTFTITNLGMYEIDAFTPIINLPECAILGVGRIVPKPVVVDEEKGSVAVRQMVSLSLTFDHRLTDGAPAARFLQRIKHAIEKPELLPAPR